MICTRVIFIIQILSRYNEAKVHAWNMWAIPETLKGYLPQNELCVIIY